MLFCDFWAICFWVSSRLSCKFCCLFWVWGCFYELGLVLTAARQPLYTNNLFIDDSCLAFCLWCLTVMNSIISLIFALCKVTWCQDLKHGELIEWVSHLELGVYKICQILIQKWCFHEALFGVFPAGASLWKTNYCRICNYKSSMSMASRNCFFLVFEPPPPPVIMKA